MNLHGRPTAAELAAAVGEFLREEVMPALDGRLRFHTLVAANVLGVIERELTLGPAQQDRHAARLAALGVGDDAELAAAVRAGEFDQRTGELVDALWDSVRDKVAVANPKHLVEGD